MGLGKKNQHQMSQKRSRSDEDEETHRVPDSSATLRPITFNTMAVAFPTWFILLGNDPWFRSACERAEAFGESYPTGLQMALKHQYEEKANGHH